VSDEQQIRDLVAKWMAATKAGDHAAVLELMTDDVVFLVAGQPPFGKAEFAARQPARGARPTIDGRSEIQEIHVVGDLAYMWTRLAVEMMPPGGTRTKRAGHTLSILRKTGGKWRLARDANLLAPAD
jgi:uncharacterized protein (TIGR02246 family)